MSLSPGNPFWHPDHDDPPDSVGQPDHEDQRSWTFQQVGKSHHHHHHGRGERLIGAKSQLFSENLKWWAPFIDCYLHKLPNLAALIFIIILIIIIIVIIIYEHFYRLPNLATLDMSRNKIVEIEQGAFEGAYSIDEM